MSSNYTAGQWVGTIVGAIVGFYTGGAGWAATASAMAAGASVGGAIGGAIDPPPGPHIVGPRLNDLSQQGASYGTVIPRIYGSAGMAGNIFWIENNALKETSNTTSSGGKGGGGGSETETFSYSATFALGLCEGPIAGVRRIWISGKLIYDAGSDDIGTIRATNAAAAGLRVYTGSESQNPDSRMQATLGVANTPAYRGLAYIVFDDLQLADYGNTLIGAQIKVEVLSDATTGYYVPTGQSFPSGGFTNIKHDGYKFIATGNGVSNFLTSQDAVTWISHSLPSTTNRSSKVAFGGGNYVSVAKSDQSFVSKDGNTWIAAWMPVSQAWTDIVYANGSFLAIGEQNYACVWARSDTGTGWTSFTGPAILPWSKIHYFNGVYVALPIYSDSPGYGTQYAYSDDGGTTWHMSRLPIYISGWVSADNGTQLVIFNDYSDHVISTTNGIDWQFHSASPGLLNLGGDAVWDGDNWVVSDHNWIFWVTDLTTWTSYASPKDLIAGLAYNGAVICGINNSRCMTIRKRTLTINQVPLSNIVSSECTKSGLITSGDIDVTSLTDDVRGYRIASVAAIRSNIDPLQGAWPFDVVQSGYQIKFKRRAGSSVATIDAAMLGAMTDGKIEPRFTQTREMDSQLPYRVNLTYMDAGREYDQGEQYAERLNTDSINVRTIEMPIVLTADEAAQKSEILLYMYWLERYEIAFKLPPQYGYLEPADIITVNTENGTYYLRLTSVNYMSNGIIECSAKFNDNAVYTSNATTDTGTLPDGTITLPGPSIYTLLDIPLLLDTYDTSGFVVAMGGITSSWPGGSIFKSADSGQTWAMINGFAAPSVIGSASNSIAAPDDFRLIDKESRLTVSLYGGQSLSSVTEAQMLNGANHFAYGMDGRWEIIAAQNCDLQGDGTYILSDLLRGRFGSEWAMGSHAAGDGVVLLDPLRIQFATTNLNLIGANLDYRGVSAGQNINSVSSASFSYDGVNLECLAPVYLNGNRHPSTNDWSLEWIRRTRVGGEWRDYVDATLGEASEAYEVEIYSSAAYTTLKRTITGLATPAATYTSANQVTDFGSNQATLYVKIYQLSANVGRGYPLTTSITR